MSKENLTGLVFEIFSDYFLISKPVWDKNELSAWLWLNVW